MDILDWEIIVTIQRVLSQVNSFNEIFLRAGEFVRNQELLNFRLPIHEAPRVEKLVSHLHLRFVCSRIVGISATLSRLHSNYNAVRFDMCFRSYSAAVKTYKRPSRTISCIPGLELAC